MVRDISITVKDEKIRYNAYNLVKAFFPDARVSCCVCADNEERVTVSIDGKSSITASDAESLYLSLSGLEKRTLPWGMLTGVRPTKLAAGWIRENQGNYGSRDLAEQAFVKWFGQNRFVSGEKARLAFDIAERERNILEKVSGIRKEKLLPGHSIYVSVPFCPSVCSYCSFSAGNIDRYADKVEDYLDALLREMQNWKDLSEMYPFTIYIGGGTPTSLSEAQLERLLCGMEKLFDIKNGIDRGFIKEFTVEAGRPDSITEKKLDIIRQAGAGRLCINPQTMQDKTLERTGRKHNSAQTAEAFLMAREKGFDNINMDLIMGLYGENIDDVNDTLEKIRILGPDSLTVHSLAVKRASALGEKLRQSKNNIPGRNTGVDKNTIERDCQAQEQNGAAGNSDELLNKNALDTGRDVERMICAAMDCAYSMGMKPYYLYRQKDIAGNFENIGYARPGREGLYNIVMMEEVQSIAAFGAGAAGKEVKSASVPNPDRHLQASRIIRTENPKNIDEYIRRQKK